MNLRVFRLPARGALVFLSVVTAAHAQFQYYVGYPPARYVVIHRQPMSYDAYEDRSYGAPDACLYDYVNRANRLTPEPVWREMFPGIHARIAAERRQFGISGEARREQLYWREYR
ncbi:MAG: hypothetical protein QOD99_1522 [Chthoniobacter sp.]|jgi:hypothetical protein|nr:hypothetical protein [Chthoniobacter sp.]